VKPRRGIGENSWHSRAERALVAIGAEREGDGGALLHATNQSARRPGAKSPSAIPSRRHVPDWLHSPAPPEARPPRPLAPSAISADTLAAPPPSAALADAARRGILLHQLFERLPGVPPGQRLEAALRWLERSAGLLDPAAREAIAYGACNVLANPDYADLFGPGSLAEAPIAATLPDGRVIAGTVDRLLVDPAQVRVIDFKTGSHVPAGAADVPRPHLAQMAAYAEVLRVIFPGRTVEAALLYTAGPKLLRLAC